ncbi:MAG: MFS transporter, partial [Anaerovoracaceae bacterium]
TGIITDKTKKYWTMTIVGYIIDCMAIPALALVPKGGWVIACILIVIQRTGKAVKKPAKDTILSFASTQGGVGKSFAIQEFLDQLGAFLGPVILFIVMAMKKNEDLFSTYSFCFAILGIPGLATILLLFFAKRKYPAPENFEAPSKEDSKPLTLNKNFILYIIGISVFAAGFMDFSLITMHTAKTGLIPDDTLPLIYAAAMAVDAVSALFFGWLFDRGGVKVLAISTVVSAAYPAFIFLNNTRTMLIVGVILWGIGMGAQESIFKAAVTKIVPKESRSKGFGIFQTSFGVCWFIGSWIMGLLYDRSLTWMVIFSIATQLVSVPFYIACGRKQAA